MYLKVTVKKCHLKCHNNFCFDIRASDLRFINQTSSQMVLWNLENHRKCFYAQIEPKKQL